MMSRPKITLPRGVLPAALLVAAAALVLGGCGGSDENKAKGKAELQTVSFQQPEDPGPDPFTEPADTEGGEEVAIPASQTGGGDGNQPFGGSGSNRVCDRDKLIRFLERNPERMREWARVLGIDPNIRAVKKYIAKLHPVTLTRDTQVTNHSFTNGRAVPFQAILQAGTAVLVDKYGTPVVRCYCGNPLKPAVFTKSAKCKGCPPDYKPPKQCEYGGGDDYDHSYYSRDYYGNQEYDEVFISSQRRSPYRDCYKAYPDPPVVTIVDVFPPPEPQSEPQVPQQTQPQPQPEPQPEPQQPDICSDGLDNEGVPGLIDSDDPNCQ